MRLVLWQRLSAQPWAREIFRRAADPSTLDASI
jgi:hypothetical protein